MSKGLKEAQLDAGGAEVIRQSAQRGGGVWKENTSKKHTSRTIQAADLLHIVNHHCVPSPSG